MPGRTENSALTQANLAIAEVRALAKEFGTTHTLVNQALKRIEESVAVLAKAKTDDIKEVKDEVRAFREEQNGRWFSLSVKINVLLGGVCMTLVGVIYRLVTHQG